MEERFTQQDMTENRTWAALGYLVFFLPLLQCPDSKLGRWCANQGLIVTVLIVLVSVLFKIFTVVPFIGWLFRIIGGVACLALVILQLMCFVQLMTNRKVTRLPYVGTFKLLPGLDGLDEETEETW